MSRKQIAKDAKIKKFKDCLRRCKNYEWIDLDSETAKITSDIGKQFLAFIKRYGIRIIQ